MQNISLQALFSARFALRDKLESFDLTRPSELRQAKMVEAAIDELTAAINAQQAYERWVSSKEAEVRS